MESWLSRLEALIHDYVEEVQTLERNRKFGDGLFGLRPGPADNPCHDRFAADVKRLFEDCRDAAPDSGECAGLLRCLFTAAEPWRELRSAYWMLIAVQGCGMELIDRLSHADAAALAELYAAQYPRHERLPVQDKLLKKLRAV